MEILQNFVTFSEYMNFNLTPILKRNMPNQNPQNFNLKGNTIILVYLLVEEWSLGS